jgi:EAL domain-containing protein (putative c-di-GMP-specific phosphodiesterase class I)
LFSFDYIKIDKMFIDNVTDEPNKVLIQGIIETAHVLGIEVVAEGVETEEQFNILKSIDCDMIQGYYFSKPLAPNDLQEYVKNNHAQQCNQRLESLQET